MLLALSGAGRSFVFHQRDLLPNQRSRTREQAISEHSRVGQRDTLQHLGPGRDEITLSGSIFPLHLGSAESLDDLARLADQGHSFQLIDSQGRIHGLWMIGNISEQETFFDRHGRAQQIDFTVQLLRTGR